MNPNKEPTWITCRCGARWTARGAAHCGSCHETFSGPSNFDAHRATTGDHGRCRPPATITNSAGERLLFFRRGMWRSPEMTEEDKTTRFGRATR
ncbi:MAG: hypothetical protein ACRDRO_14235 [Pseudonocardiaceae bacterium]